MKKALSSMREIIGQMVKKALVCQKSFVFLVPWKLWRQQVRYVLAEFVHVLCEQWPTVFPRPETNQKKGELYLVSSSASPTTPVDVILIMVRTRIVDDQDQVLDIEAARSYGGSDEQPVHTGFEVVDDRIAVVLIDTWVGQSDM